MTSRAEALIRKAAIPPLMRMFGEPVTLASGATIAGIFDPIGDPAQSPWDETGISQRMSQQPNPSLQIRDADASGLAERDTLTVRGTEYVIARMDPDGYGLTRIELMPSQAASADDSARWR